MKKLKLAYYLLRYLGLRWLIFRLGYAIKQKTAYLIWRMPICSWESLPLKHFLSNHFAEMDIDVYVEYRKQYAPLFFFSGADKNNYNKTFTEYFAEELPELKRRADNIGKGVFRYFEYHEIAAGFPPDWHENVFDQLRSPDKLHWSRIHDFGYGDIKTIWELSRFTFVYTLVRAYWYTGEECYAEYFWQLFEDWRQHNPPNCGVNWKCGQEISFRLMAWCFALYGFLSARSSTSKRIAGLAQMIAVSADRVAKNINYALSQRNNHGISEAVGLWTVGILFPEFKAAQNWERKGRRLLEKLARTLIYKDGSFSQHSVNYQRLMLQDYLWVLRLADIQSKPFSKRLQEQIHKSYQFLYQLLDQEFGRLPNYGQNDGALILPLDNSDYTDFRPVIQALHYYFYQNKCLVSGHWDEGLLWLYGSTALQAEYQPIEQHNLTADIGGYYTLRNSKGFAFIRAAQFYDRPGQADMLHADIWWKGLNIMQDAGTFSYNALDPWNNPFAHTQYHNTIVVDGFGQMQQAGKFLWLPWIRGNCLTQSKSSQNQIAYWEGSHNGYQRLEKPVSYRRAIIRIGEEHWLILDNLQSKGLHDYQLHFLLADLPYNFDQTSHQIDLEAPYCVYQIITGTSSSLDAACKVIRADAASPAGWVSPYYYARLSALSFTLSVQTKDVLFWTLLGPGKNSILQKENCLLIQSNEWQCELTLADKMDKSIIDTVKFTGYIEDYLSI